MRDAPDWLVDEPVHQTDLGALTSGKEAQIDLVERTAADGRTCLIARKRYRPREVTQKGELEGLGFQSASTFRRDDRYRPGRDLRLGERERRAMASRSRFGRELLRGQWTDHEFTVLGTWWEAGVNVPYPVGHDGGSIDMEYVGDLDGAAPQLRAARLNPEQLGEACRQVVEGLAAIVGAGWVHGDLSAYNLLWWDDAVWFIDVPQAVNVHSNLDALDLLHRDVTNVFGWFEQRGLDVDAEAAYAELLGVLF